MKKRGLIVLFLFVVVTGAGVWTAFTRQTSVRQPIAYNHKIHLQDVGLECIDCHQYYERLARAGIPTLAVCAECHSEPVGDSPAEAAVVRHLQEDNPIPWRHVNQLPKDVYFSHLRHVKLGRLECARCHGPVAELEIPMGKPFIPLKMSWCIDCHRERTVSNDCLKCHR